MAVKSERIDRYGETEFFDVIRRGYTTEITAYINLGVNLNHKNKEGRRPLFYANYSDAKLLIHYGAVCWRNNGVGYLSVFKLIHNTWIRQSRDYMVSLCEVLRTKFTGIEVSWYILNCIDSEFSDHQVMKLISSCTSN